MLPGVGPKSAQRMAYHMLLNKNKVAANMLAENIKSVLQKITNCNICCDLTDSSICKICQDNSRDSTKLCVVEMPQDVLAVEKCSNYNGYYFVLMGHLSPIDNIGPDDLSIDKFEKRLLSKEITEVILATNPTVEGETTAHYLSQITKSMDIKTTRIAHGVPVGGELDYLDSGTLANALEFRSKIID